MSSAWPLVVAVNYHRIGEVDPTNPLHRLHTVAANVFEEQIAAMANQGPFIALEALDDPGSLAPINFALSFDDVPTAALTGIDILEARSIPYTLAVCTRLAQDGHGLRDKVYAICHALTVDDIYDTLQPEVGDLLPAREGFSFYSWSKSTALPHNEMQAQVIDPLFAAAGHSLAGVRGYLSWDQLRAADGRPGMTIANHGHSHPNYATLTADQIQQDITAGHQHIHNELGQEPQWLAVPFGRIDQRVCVDILAALDPLGYRGVLWAGSTSLVAQPRPAPAIRHIFRLHAPTDTAGMNAAIAEMVEPANQCARVFDALPSGQHRGPVDIVDGETVAQLRPLERILREEKPYALNERYFAHQFHDNPARNGRPAYHAVVNNGRPEAILYNFHATFQVAGRTVPGVYLAGWRRLPHAHQVATGLLLRRVADREPVVGVADPNPDIAHAFSNWHRVECTTHHLPATTAPRHGDVEDMQQFPTELTPLVRDWSMGFEFTLQRTAALYRWRFDEYPLAACHYVVLRRRTRPIGYGAIVAGGTVWSLSDYILEPGAGALIDLVQAVQGLAGHAGASTVEVRTSNAADASAIRQLKPKGETAGCTYYHLNPARLTDHGVNVASINWPHLVLHDTEVCGDVLLRPQVGNDILR